MTGASSPLSQTPERETVDSRRQRNAVALAEAKRKKRERAAKRAKRGGKVVRGGQVVVPTAPMPAVEIPDDPDLLVAMDRDDLVVLIDDAVEAYFTPGARSPGRAGLANLLRAALFHLVPPS